MKLARWGTGGIVALLVAAAAAGVVWMKWRGPAVEVARAEDAPIVHAIVVSGRVQAPNRIEIGSVITGRVAQVRVTEGDVVEAGQPLIELDPQELRAGLEQARAAEATARTRIASVAELSLPQSADALAQSEAQLRFAEADYQRQRALRDKGFISDARLDDAERQVAVARSQVESARTQRRAQGSTGVAARDAVVRLREAAAARELAEAKLAQTVIRASVPGTVLVRSVEPGDIVTSAKRLLVIASRGETRLTAQIDERNLPYLREGSRAIASSDAFPGERFDAVLYYVSPGVDTSRGSVEGRFRVAAPPPYLRADMTVSIDIEVASKDRARVVPAAAVREAEGRATVQRLEDGRVATVPVTLGIRGGAKVEVLSGLEAGDTVLLTRGLADGARARVR
ncbi:MAG: efflux RND transporter periplasmic adaptor subunit [bacterium]|jgi:HlyD family secretion protein|nr:efflux RND transporter periplasmic adaptor subunit [Betaproteobacteria bacterium]